MNFNLIDEDWIPVLYCDGKARRVGIRRAFEEAGQIRQIAASNPMDRVAVLRFLLAIFYWCAEDRTDVAISADSFRDEWFTQLDLNRECFNLLGDSNRFYQDKSTPANSRPIGDLLVEFPTETKIAHLHRLQDKRYGLCPACCALGIVRFCTWANAYGGGRYTSAVNGPAPAFAVPHGGNLYQTLVMNWTPSRTSKREPPWLNTEGPEGESDLDVTTVMAWRSRRLWLGDPGKEDETCAYCGNVSKLIKQMAFTGNWPSPIQVKGQDKKFWPRDPHLVLDEKHNRDNVEVEGSEEKSPEPSLRKGRRGNRSEEKTTLGFPIPASRAAVHTRFWRRALQAILGSNVTRDVTAPHAFIVAGPAANKGLYQDAAALRFPGACVQAGTAAYLDTLRMLVESLTGVLMRSTPNPKRQHPNRRAALDALSPYLEATLREGFEAGLSSQRLAQEFAAVIEYVARATTRGSPFRRREALDRARNLLIHKMEDLITDWSSLRASNAPEIPRSVGGEGVQDE